MDDVSVRRSVDSPTRVDSQQVSERVVTAVADATDTSPENLTPPLFSVVDPEALDALVESMPSVSPAAPGSVTFTYCGCDVTVSADGRVTVDEIDE